MNNTNTQVNPGNRVNFSKIRKASQGIKIPKFQVPAGGIGNRKNTHVTQDEWWNAHNQANIAQWAKIAAEHPEMTLEELNNFIAQNHNLYTSTGYNGNKAIKGEGVNQYQRDYHNKYGFGNTDAFWNGWGNAYSGNSLSSVGKNASDSRQGEGQQFTGDDYFGEQTNRRIANYFTDSELAQANEAVKSRGWHWELADYNDQDNRSGVGGRKFYKLVADTTPPPPPPPPPPGEIPEDNPEETYEDLEFESLPGRQGTPWTDWAPLSGILGNNLMNNVRVFNDEVKKKFPLQEAPYLQGKVTNNYAARQIRNQQIADARSRAQQQMGSDIVQNQNYLNAVEQRADELENQNAIDRTQEFNTTSQKLQEIENQNKLSESATANYNRQQNAAAWNNILAARQRLNTANTAELNSYIGNMYASHGQWLQNERMEDARYQREMNDYLYQKGLNELYQTSGLKALEEGIQNSSAFNNFRTTLEADTENIEIPLDENGHITDGAILNYISEHGEDDNVKALQAAYAKEKADAMSRYEHEQQGLIAERTRANMRIPGTFSNQGTRFGDRFIRRNIPQQTWIGQRYKSGGKIKNARFIDYMNHYQKQQQFDRSETRKVQEGLQKKLARDMGLLDKETLMLLKLAFS